MDNSVIARSGWLMRRVSGKDWRKNWIELYRDGYLKYYENDYSPNPEDVINMPTECISIKTGLQVEESYCPPSGGYSSQCVFAVSASGNKKWIFCADSPDDMRAWQLALEQARLLISRPPHHTHPSHHHHSHSHSHPHPHHHLNHPSILHNMRLAGLPGSTLPLEEYHRLNQYSQLQHMINSRSLPLPFSPGDPRVFTYPLHLPPPNVQTSESSNNTTTVSTASSISSPVTTTSIFPIPVSAVSNHPPRLPCFNFNFPGPGEPPLRPGPLYPSINQSTSLPTTPLTSQSRMFPSPFPEPDVRNFNLDVLAGSTTSPDARLGANRLVWPPFIWW